MSSYYDSATTTDNVRCYEWWQKTLAFETLLKWEYLHDNQPLFSSSIFYSNSV